MSNNPIINLTKMMWKYSPRKSVIILYVILFFCSNAIIFFQPLVIGDILNTIQYDGVHDENIRSIVMLLGVLFSLAFGFWIFHGPARYLERRNAFLVRAAYKKYLFEEVLKLDSSWHAHHHSGDTIDKIEKGTKALYEYSGRVYEVIEVIIRFTSSFVALVYFNVHASYIMLFLVFVIIIVIMQFDKRLVPQYKQLNRVENTISAKVFDAISNISTIIILRVERIISSSVYKHIISPFALYRKNIKLDEVKWFTVSIFTSMMTFLVLGSYVYSAYTTSIAIGTVFVLYQYVERIKVLAYRFAGRYGDILRKNTAVLNAKELEEDFLTHDEENEISKHKHWKKLEIKDLEFSYDKEKVHLDGIDLDVVHGQKIALIGESGSGKTTFLKVLRELYKPSSIKIFLDGEKLEHGLSSLSEDVALIPQDPEIFATTIEENVTMGVGHAKETVHKYAAMARFLDVAKRLPNGFDSLIYEKGVNLSGGEKQRLALTRGLLAAKDKQIILLDEPTSSVDAKNERLIYEEVFKEFKEKTVLSSLHRLHLLPLFDVVLLFSNGKIIARGDFDDLMEESEEFRLLWEKYNDNKEE